MLQQVFLLLPRLALLGMLLTQALPRAVFKTNSSGLLMTAAVMWT